ncbi:hypothetical protein [Streptomyces sp. NPDC046161]|uniref:hypothetical protein n=1 Tax=Streptomyces sp. NPDC046161 TaxID=3155132 RepID=UPI0033C0BC74
MTEPTGIPNRRDPYEGFAGHVGRTFAESEPAWPPRRRPGGAPNIVVVPGAQAPYAPEPVARALREAAAAFE